MSLERNKRGGFRVNKTLADFTFNLFQSSRAENSPKESNVHGWEQKSERKSRRGTLQWRGYQLANPLCSGHWSQWSPLGAMRPILLATHPRKIGQWWWNLCGHSSGAVAEEADWRSWGGMGAFLGSGVLTRALGMVVGEGASLAPFRIISGGGGLQSGSS